MALLKAFSGASLYSTFYSNIVQALLVSRPEQGKQISTGNRLNGEYQHLFKISKGDAHKKFTDFTHCMRQDGNSALCRVSPMLMYNMRL
jgi:hypothetical protein